MTQFSELKEGSILGESQYYVVEKIVGERVQVKAGDGHVVLDKKYVETYLNSAEQFTKKEEITKTGLADLFINNPRIVMTVAFVKQDKPKTIKAYKAEIEEQAKKVQEDLLKRGIVAVTEALSNPISKVIPGELRIMRGRHYGEIDEFGRIQFTDMDITEGTPIRAVDPRTIQYLIVNDTYYKLK